MVALLSTEMISMRGLDARAAGVSAGELLADKYRIEEVLGVGGMGIVVAARHVELDEKVAIKVLLPKMLDDSTAVARFYREAKAAARIKNEHVATVFDVGRLPNGAPFMVMEFLEGSDLSSWVEQHGALPLGQAVDFLVQACVAVADAHALGIVHRDLKPANLFCVRRSDGRLSIKVLDFGISKVTEANQQGASFTQTSTVMGSPQYMSPEQFRSSKNIDGRTDIWALGAILYELVTGRAPFTATSMAELAIMIATEPVASPLTFRRDLPEGLAAAIIKCLQKEPERRFRDVAQLAAALSPFAPPAARASIDRVTAILERPELTASMPTLGASVNVAETETSIDWATTAPPRRRRVALGVGAAAAVLVVVATVVGWWSMRDYVAPSTKPPEAKVSVAIPAPMMPLPPEPTATDSFPGGSPTAQVPVTPFASNPEAAKPQTTGEAPVRARRPSSVPTSASRSKRSTASVAPSAVASPVRGRQSPPRADCDPPFYFDASGNRVFKQECL